jgi:hypothetical protein
MLYINKPKNYINMPLFSRHMGFLDKVKGMFAKEPEVTEEISLENIDAWFEKKYSSKKDFLRGQIEGIRAKIKEQASSAKENAENLKNAQLRNPNIPEKAKHYMEGNRETYIKRTEQFLEHLNVPTSAEHLKDFLADFEKRIEEFGKYTLRPYAILKEFFEEEASKIAANIREIDNLTKEVKKVLKESKIKEMDSIKEDISRLKNKINQKKSISDEISKKESLVGDSSKEKQKLTDTLDEKKSSKEYRDYQHLKQKLETTKKATAEKEAEISHVFSSLERPLKKYLRVAFSDKNLLEKYIANPVGALTQDFGLKIVSILENMKKSITDNTIELKDKQKQRARADIEKLSKEFLSKFLSEYAQIKKKEDEIKKEMKSFTVMDEINSAKEKLDITSAMLDKAKQDYENLNMEYVKIDIEKLKKELAEKINSAAEAKVVIS